MVEYELPWKNLTDDEAQAVKREFDAISDFTRGRHTHIPTHPSDSDDRVPRRAHRRLGMP